jgi:electron transfer flavoprotein alpha subunit
MILVLVEARGPSGSEPLTLDELSLEALTLARRLGERVEAVLVRETGVGASEPQSLGVARLHAVEHPRLDTYAPAAWAQALVELVERERPQAIVAAGSERGQEVLAHAAARLGAPLAANCVAVQAGDPWTVTRQRWGGSLLEEARLTGSVKLITVAPHAVAAEPAADGATAEVVRFTPTLSEEDLRVRVVRREEPPAGAVSLTDARVVVGGGRGVGSAEGFALLEELAQLLGGAVGGSRVVTNLGWRPHSDQVGQTGARIAPDLYIACGISGAIQHIVGCKAAKRILAVNKDRNAPIVARADWAAIGDLHEILPAVIAELRRAREAAESAAATPA